MRDVTAYVLRSNDFNQGIDVGLRKGSVVVHIKGTSNSIDLMEACDVRQLVTPAHFKVATDRLQIRKSIDVTYFLGTDIQIPCNFL